MIQTITRENGAVRESWFCGRCKKALAIRTLIREASIPVIHTLNLRSACCNEPVTIITEVVPKETAFDQKTYPYNGADAAPGVREITVEERMTNLLRSLNSTDDDLASLTEKVEKLQKLVMSKLVKESKSRPVAPPDPVIPEKERCGKKSDHGGYTCNLPWDHEGNHSDTTQDPIIHFTLADSCLRTAGCRMEPGHDGDCATNGD